MTPGTPIALIVDDDADIRTLLDRVLTQSGFQTVLTANAIDGVAAVEEFEPLVTMLDVSMPGMDGFAAARKIREFSDTYIVMLTALSDEIDVIQGLGAGADDYLLKPFRPRELRARIESLLRRPRQRLDEPPLPTTEPGPADRAAPAVWTAGQQTVNQQAPAPVQAPAPQYVQPAVQQPIQPQQPHQPQQPGGQPQTWQEPAAEYPAAPVPHVDPAGRTIVEKQVVHELSNVRSVDDWIDYHGLRLNTATGEVLCDGRPVSLNSSEFALMATLLESGRRVRSTANLVLTLRGESYVTTYYVNEADKNAVKEHMVSLRRKLGDTDVTPRWIENVRGVGYRMAQD